MINEKWKAETIEAMGKAAYKASGTVSFDDRVRADPLVFYTIIAEAAFNTMIARIPNTAPESKHPHDMLVNEGTDSIYLVQQLKALRSNDD